MLGVMRNYDTGSPLQREPALTAVEAEHGARLRDHIAAALEAAGGWFGFDRYMDLALYAPGLGYYSAGARKFGGGGDFTTAPEISPLFGACVARQCAEVLNALPGSSILEIGAGSGRLAGDILENLEKSAALPRRYRILEVSADLRARQRAYLEERLPHLAARVEWLDAPPEEPFDGVIVANEVLDALPVKRFRWHCDRVEEMGVALTRGEFVWAARPGSAELAAYCGTLAAAAGGRWDDGYVSECCPRLPAWAASVTRGLRAGVALWIDYGLPRAQYYLPERRDGTLLCHFRQRVSGNPFLRPGLQDITAWVDFTHVAEAGARAGFDIAGYTTQTYFLAALGIDERMRDLAADDQNHLARLANQARQLMMPGEMGERFKAMAWRRGLTAALSGFLLRDLRHTL